MSREAIVSALVMAVVVVVFLSAIMPKAKFYRMMYNAAAIPAAIGFLGVLASAKAMSH